MAKLTEGSGKVLLEDLLDPVSTSDAATKNYVDTRSHDTNNLMDGSVTTPKLADEAVETAKIDDGAVTTPKLSDDAVTNAKLADDAVQAAQIADGTITEPKLSITNSPTVGQALTAASGGQFTWADQSLADGSVTTAKLANDAVTHEKVADDAIDTDELVDNAVTRAKMADNSVGSSEILNDAVTTEKIADGNVVTASIADNAVTTDKIADSAVHAAQLNADAVTADKILDGNVETAKLADNAVTNAKLANNAVDLANLNAGTSEATQVLTATATGIDWAYASVGNFRSYANFTARNADTVVWYEGNIVLVTADQNDTNSARTGDDAPSAANNGIYIYSDTLNSPSNGVSTNNADWTKISDGTTYDPNFFSVTNNQVTIDPDTITRTEINSNVAGLGLSQATDGSLDVTFTPSERLQRDSNERLQVIPDTYRVRATFSTIGGTNGRNADTRTWYRGNEVFIDGVVRRDTRGSTAYTVRRTGDETAVIGGVSATTDVVVGDEISTDAAGANSFIVTQVNSVLVNTDEVTVTAASVPDGVGSSDRTAYFTEEFPGENQGLFVFNGTDGDTDGTTDADWAIVDGSHHTPPKEDYATVALRNANASILWRVGDLVSVGEEVYTYVGPSTDKDLDGSVTQKAYHDQVRKGATTNDEWTQIGFTGLKGDTIVDTRTYRSDVELDSVFGFLSTAPWPAGTLMFTSNGPVNTDPTLHNELWTATDGGGRSQFLYIRLPGVDADGEPFRAVNSITQGSVITLESEDGVDFASFEVDNENPFQFYSLYSLIRLGTLRAGSRGSYRTNTNYFVSVTPREVPISAETISGEGVKNDTRYISGDGSFIPAPIYTFNSTTGRGLVPPTRFSPAVPFPTNAARSSQVSADGQAFDGVPGGQSIVNSSILAQNQWASINGLNSPSGNFSQRRAIFSPSTWGWVTTSGTPFFMMRAAGLSDIDTEHRTSLPSFTTTALRNADTTAWRQGDQAIVTGATGRGTYEYIGTELNSGTTADSDWVFISSNTTFSSKGLRAWIDSSKAIINFTIGGSGTATDATATFVLPTRTGTQTGISITGIDGSTTTAIATSIAGSSSWGSTDWVATASGSVVTLTRRRAGITSDRAASAITASLNEGSFTFTNNSSNSNGRDGIDCDAVCYRDGSNWAIYQIGDVVRSDRLTGFEQPQIYFILEHFNSSYSVGRPNNIGGDTRTEWYFGLERNRTAAFTSTAGRVTITEGTDLAGTLFLRSDGTWQSVGQAQLADGSVSPAKLLVDAGDQGFPTTGNDDHLVIAKGDDSFEAIDVGNGLELSGDNLQVDVNGTTLTSAAAGLSVADSGITSTQIQDGAVINSKLGDGAVDTQELANSSVTEAKINNGAVTEDKIGAGAVTRAKIGANAVGAAELADDAVTLSQIENTIGDVDTLVTEADNYTRATTGTAPTSGQIWFGTNANTVISGASAINTVRVIKVHDTDANSKDVSAVMSQMKAGSRIKVQSGTTIIVLRIDSATFASDVLTVTVDSNGASDFLFSNGDNFPASGTWDVLLKPAALDLIGGGDILNDSISTTHIQDAAVTSAKLSVDSVIEAKIAANAVTEGKINDGAVTNGKLGSGAVTDAKITTNTIGGDKLNISGTYSSTNRFLTVDSSDNLVLQEIIAGGHLDRADIEGLIGGTDTLVSHSQLTFDSTSTPPIPAGTFRLFDAIAGNSGDTMSTGGSFEDIRRMDINPPSSGELASVISRMVVGSVIHLQMGTARAFFTISSISVSGGIYRYLFQNAENRLYTSGSINGTTGEIYFKISSLELLDGNSIIPGSLETEDLSASNTAATNNVPLAVSGGGFTWSNPTDLNRDLPSTDVATIAVDDLLPFIDESDTNNASQKIQVQNFAGDLSNQFYDGRYEPKFSHARQPLDTIPSNALTTSTTELTGGVQTNSNTQGWGFYSSADAPNLGVPTSSTNFQTGFPSTWAGFFASPYNHISFNPSAATGVSVFNTLFNGHLGNENIYIMAIGSADNSYAIWRWVGRALQTNRGIHNRINYTPELVTSSGTPGTQGTQTIQWYFNLTSSNTISHVTTLANTAALVRRADDSWGQVGATQLADGGVTHVKLAANAVESDNIADNAVTASKLPDSVVTSAKIANGTIAAVDLGSDAVTTAKILDANVTHAKLADDSVDQTNLIFASGTPATGQVLTIAANDQIGFTDVEAELSTPYVPIHGTTNWPNSVTAHRSLAAIERVAAGTNVNSVTGSNTWGTYNRSNSQTNRVTVSRWTDYFNTDTNSTTGVVWNFGGTSTQAAAIATDVNGTDLAVLAAWADEDNWCVWDLTPVTSAMLTGGESGIVRSRPGVDFASYILASAGVPQDDIGWAVYTDTGTNYLNTGTPLRAAVPGDDLAWSSGRQWIKFIGSDGGIGSFHLADNSVTTPKIRDLNVTTQKLALSAVGTQQLATGAATKTIINPSIVDDSGATWGTSTLANTLSFGNNHYRFVDVVQNATNVNLLNTQSDSQAQISTFTGSVSGVVPASGGSLVPNWDVLNTTAAVTDDLAYDSSLLVDGGRGWTAFHAGGGFKLIQTGTTTWQSLLFTSGNSALDDQLRFDDQSLSANVQAQLTGDTAESATFIIVCDHNNWAIVNYNDGPSGNVFGTTGGAYAYAQNGREAGGGGPLGSVTFKGEPKPYARIYLPFHRTTGAAITNLTMQAGDANHFLSADGTFYNEESFEFDSPEQVFALFETAETVMVEFDSSSLPARVQKDIHYGNLVQRVTAAVTFVNGLPSTVQLYNGGWAVGTTPTSAHLLATKTVVFTSNGLPSTALIT